MSGGGQNTQTSGQVPSWASPYYQNNAATGASLASQPATSMVAPLTAMQTQGLNQVQTTANGVSPSASAASANEFETSGALLNPSNNPYLQGTFNQAANSVQSQLASEFAGSGSNVINSLPVQSDEMNNLATQLYGGAYNTGLQAETQATALAPSIEQGTYIPAQQLYGAGSAQQQQDQNLVNAPYNALSWYSGVLGQNGQPFLGSTSTTTQSNNPLLTALGGATTLGGLLGGGSSPLGSLGSLIGSLGSGLTNYLGGYTQAPTGSGANQLNTITPYDNSLYDTSTGLLNPDGSLNEDYLNFNGAGGQAASNGTGQQALSDAGVASQGASLLGKVSNNSGLSGLGAGLGSTVGLIQGLNSGGVTGDLQAASSAARLASVAGGATGLLSSGAASGLGTAAGAIAAPLALYNAANSWQSGDTGSDALGGLQAGASVGSIFGPVGTLIGGAIGGAVGAASSAFGGGKQDPETQMTYSANAAGSNALQGASPSSSFQYLAGVLDAKNNTSGHSTDLEQVFGREGEGNVLNGMASQIDSAVSGGQITPQSNGGVAIKTGDGTVIYNAQDAPGAVYSTVVEPWLSSQGVSQSSLTFKDAKGNSSGQNLQSALQNLVGAYMNGSLTASTPIGVSGQQDSTLPSLAGLMGSQLSSVAQRPTVLSGLMA